MKEIIQQKIEAALRELQGKELPAFDMPAIEVARPKDERFGEYTTNVAMGLGKMAGMNPREVAEKIVSSIKYQVSPTSQSDDASDSSPRAGEQEKELFEKIEVAGPGHINFYLSQKALTDVLREAVAKGGHFGDSEIGKGKRVDNEFISANPTGPLHLGNARGGFYGDAISRVLRKVGYDVTNEYYINDAGEQTLKLAHSVCGDDEAVYSGDYIEQLRGKLDISQSIEATAIQASAAVLTVYIKPTATEKMGIIFDSWISEKKDIIEAGLVDKAIETLKEKGLTFESEGALWLRTTDFGDDKDRVLVKSDGAKTYFASDCGYILHKMERDFVTLIEIWGADHHGYVTRFRAAATALGFEGEIRFFLMQLVRLVKNGKEVRMSKRAGNVVSVDELLEKIPVDVARFFFLLYSPDTHMNFDLGLAEERSAKNPVYYVQYAHARLASILRKAAEIGLSFDCHSRDGGNPDLSILTHPKERELLRDIVFFLELVSEVADTYAVHRLPQYAIRLADKLHSYYDECRVIDEGDVDVSNARLALVSGVKVVLGETLRLMGVSAPERMESASGNNEQEITDRDRLEK